MPKVTIWVRVEDHPKWQAIKNKPEWLHERLNEQGTQYHKPIVKKLSPKQVKDYEDVSGFKTTGDVTMDMSSPAVFDAMSELYESKESVASQLSQCPHYQPKGQCLVKGCKYGR